MKNAVVRLFPFIERVHESDLIDDHVVNKGGHFTHKKTGSFGGAWANCDYPYQMTLKRSWGRLEHRNRSTMLILELCGMRKQGV